MSYSRPPLTYRAPERYVYDVDDEDGANFEEVIGCDPHLGRGGQR